MMNDAALDRLRDYFTALSLCVSGRRRKPQGILSRLSAVSQPLKTVLQMF